MFGWMWNIEVSVTAIIEFSVGHRFTSNTLANPLRPRAECGPLYQYGMFEIWRLNIASRLSVLCYSLWRYVWGVMGVTGVPAPDTLRDVGLLDCYGGSQRVCLRLLPPLPQLTGSDLYICFAFNSDLCVNTRGFGCWLWFERLKECNTLQKPSFIYHICRQLCVCVCVRVAHTLITCQCYWGALLLGLVGLSLLHPSSTQWKMPELPRLPLHLRWVFLQKPAALGPPCLRY